MLVTHFKPELIESNNSLEQSNKNAARTFPQWEFQLPTRKFEKKESGSE
jgi:hypothetical protein